MKRISSLVMLLLLLTSCGGASGPQPTITSVSQPIEVQIGSTPTVPLATVDQNCRKQELEGWIQASGQHTRALVDTLNTRALITPPDQMAGLLSNVNAIYDLVKAAPQPSCAQSSVDLVISLFESVISQLTAYSSGQQVDLGKLVGGTIVAYEQFKLKDEEMRQLYRTLPRG